MEVDLLHVVLWAGFKSRGEIQGLDLGRRSPWRIIVVPRRLNIDEQRGNVRAREGIWLGKEETWGKQTPTGIRGCWTTFSKKAIPPVVT